MIAPGRLYHFLVEQGISFYTGVPDSLLKHFLKYIQDNAAASDHIITANEGLAIALASGYHMATGKLPLVYLQNSGLGNIINPLTSLADKEMYSVPMLLLIGWRGRPGTPDEPQHVKMGRITPSLLDVLEVPYHLLEENEETTFAIITKAITQAMEKQQPVALLVPEELFEKYNDTNAASNYTLQRENVIKKIIGSLKGDEIIICTTGKMGREFYEQNKIAGQKISKYLLSVGAMGHANHIALGIHNQGGKKVIMLDGDGAILMHMGALATLANHVGEGFIHIVINNGSHESVGGQPTEAFSADLCAIAKACGYTSTVCITSEAELDQWLKNGIGAHSQFIEIRTNKESRSNLGRPAGKPVGWKHDFMSAFKTTEQ